VKAAPLVSVIVACWNGSAYLAQALDSVRAQSVADWECIIVDDGSTDSSLDIAARLADADSRIRVVRQRRRGLAAARNRGIDLARGLYIQFLDADDAILPDKLALQLATLRGLPKPALAYCDYANVLSLDFERLVVPGPFYLSPRLDHQQPLADLARRWETSLSIPAHCFLFQREIFGEFGIRFFEQLPNHQDWDCWMRILELKPALCYVDQTLALYHRRPGSLSANRRRMRRGFLRAVDLQLRRHRHDADLTAVLAAKRMDVLASYADATLAARFQRALRSGIRAVLPASAHARLDATLNRWLKP
jgi:glycosyltransferase involved in cell wall biosynthesis